mgnify:CR=1 FL=1
MIELCAAHFCAQKPKNIAVANRTVARAAALAETIGAKAVGLVDLPEILPEYDILITCTASTLPIIGLGMVQSALKRRKHRPIFMIDLAVPRDIEREVDDLDETLITKPGQYTIINGVEVNENQKPMAYHLLTTSPDGWTLPQSKRVEADRVIALWQKELPSQIREMPPLARRLSESTIWKSTWTLFP